MIIVSTLNLFQGEVVYVLQRINIGPEEICSFVIGDACGDVYNPTHEWDVVFPPVPKPTPIETKILKVIEIYYLIQYYIKDSYNK
jgi:sphingomyelin phosphodiesterase